MAVASENSPIKPADASDSSHQVQTLQKLMKAVQDLSLARSLDGIVNIVRHAAREITGADGASFVLRDGDLCHYVDEDAIGPLWKGQRFPMPICISGWVMMHKQSVRIPDIYQDERIPAACYRPTFVKSLAMMPIRVAEPLGAIGVYWATPHETTDWEHEVLQSLAHATSVAFENISLYEELSRRIDELKRSNFELSRFAWVASHDLKEPVRLISTYSDLLARSHTFDKESGDQFAVLVNAAARLRALVEGIMTLVGVDTIQGFRDTDLQAVLRGVVTSLGPLFTELQASVELKNLPVVYSSSTLLSQLFQNLFSNALKFRKAGTVPHIVVEAQLKDAQWVISCKDNGIGIDSKYRETIFEHFFRLHSQDQYPGSGLGLAICRKIAGLLGGSMWVESVVGEGSTFYIALPERAMVHSPSEEFRGIDSGPVIVSAGMPV